MKDSQKAENSNWPDSVRLEMVEKSNHYDNPQVYQYGYYDGYQKRNSLPTPSQEGGSAGVWRKASDVKMEEGIQWFYKIPSNGNRGISRYVEDDNSLKFLVYGDWEAFPNDFLDKILLLDETSTPSPSQITTQLVGGLSAEEVEDSKKLWNEVGKVFHQPCISFVCHDHILKELQSKFSLSYKSQPTGEAAGDGWVEGLPPERKGWSNSVDVNVLYSDGLVSTGSYSYQLKVWQDYMYGNRGILKIIKWQPLPAPPASNQVNN